MTYASGQNFFTETFWVYVKSALKNIPNGDLVIITHDMPDKVEEALESLEVEVAHFPQEQMQYIYRDRHLAFWHYLNDHGYKYENVFVSDCKDVVFQLNPFDWVGDWRSRFDNMKGNLDFLKSFVVLVSEGFKMPSSGFACIEHFEFERDVQLPFLKKEKDRWIVNGGTMMGTPDELQNLHFLIWMTTMKSIGRITDQATLNWLLRYLEKDSTYSVSHPQTDNLCLTGEGVKEGCVEPVLKEGKLYSPNGKPYHLIHQWDRLDYLREEILAQYA